MVSALCGSEHGTSSVSSNGEPLPGVLSCQQLRASGAAATTWGAGVALPATGDEQPAHAASDVSNVRRTAVLRCTDVLQGCPHGAPGPSGAIHRIMAVPVRNAITPSGCACAGCAPGGAA